MSQLGMSCQRNADTGSIDHQLKLPRNSLGFSPPIRSCHETFSQVARKLGFNETQTLHLAIARLRDEVLEAARQGTGAVEVPYSPLTARQLLDIRSKAPQPRGWLVRRESLF